MMIVLLIIHGLLAVLLLGALTHQAISLYLGHKGPRDRFTKAVRGVRSHTYTNAVVLLFVLVFVIGTILYPDFRVNVRSNLVWDVNLKPATGSFEIKEHIAAIGLASLPAYWLAWHQSDKATVPNVKLARNALTLLLTIIVWADFLIGHVLNNIHGL
jgi:hypothetical protein